MEHFKALCLEAIDAVLDHYFEIEVGLKATPLQKLKAINESEIEELLLGSWSGSWGIFFPGATAGINVTHIKIGNTEATVGDGCWISFMERVFSIKKNKREILQGKKVEYSMSSKSLQKRISILANLIAEDKLDEARENRELYHSDTDIMDRFDNVIAGEVKRIKNYA